MSKTLADYLKTAGVAAEPAKVAAPVKPAAIPAKVAAPVAAPKVAAAPAPVAAPVAPKAPEKVADVQYNPAIIKTAEQKWLLDNKGILIPDAKTASEIYSTLANKAQAEKNAELQKVAAEFEARGVLQYRGMLKEACAMQLADGTATQFDVIKTAKWINCNPSEIVARAAELKKLAELAAAEGGAAFFGNERGRAARTSDSEMLAAAERNQNTTSFEPEAVSGTRPATRGTDEKELRFVDTVTMPNNPGLNHGQKTDNGKAGPG
jgi:hypothetical protein